MPPLISFIMSSLKCKMKYSTQWKHSKTSITTPDYILSHIHLLPAYSNSWHNEAQSSSDVMTSKSPMQTSCLHSTIAMVTLTKHTERPAVLARSCPCSLISRRDLDTHTRVFTNLKTNTQMNAACAHTHTHLQTEKPHLHVHIFSKPIQAILCFCGFSKNYIHIY